MIEVVRFVLSFLVVVTLDAGASLLALAQQVSWVVVALVAWGLLSIPCALLVAAAFGTPRRDEAGGIDPVFGENPT